MNIEIVMYILIWSGTVLLGYSIGWNKGFEEGAAIWKKCLHDVQDIYRQNV